MNNIELAEKLFNRWNLYFGDDTTWEEFSTNSCNDEEVKAWIEVAQEARENLEDDSDN